MTKTLIIANWKMNPSGLKEAKSIFESLVASLKNRKNLELVICPPSIFISDLSKLYNLTTSKSAGLFLGAQNCFWEQEGAYTGEISPAMLKKIGCSYVIIGHSERRHWLGETDEMINQKLVASLEAKLKVILCTGEDRNEEVGLVMERQVRAALRGVSRTRIKDIVITYEPIWAVGTDDPCLPEEALKSTLLIRKILTQLYDRATADQTEIIYGGSVEGSNAADYIKKSGMNGLLLGRASLKINEVLKIIKNIELLESFKK